MQSCCWSGYVVNKTTLLSAALLSLCKHLETWWFNPLREAKRFGSLVGAAGPQPWNVGLTMGHWVSGTATAGEGDRASFLEQTHHVGEISSEQESQDSRAPWGPWCWGGFAQMQQLSSPPSCPGWKWPTEDSCPSPLPPTLGGVGICKGHSISRSFIYSLVCPSNIH